MRRLAFIVSALLLSTGCNSDLCKSGRSEIHDPDLYLALIQSLKEQDIEFKAIEGNVVCYEAKSHDRLRAEIIRIHQLTHPIGSRIDVARGMDEEVFDSLNQAGVRYEWFIEKDWLVLIINPEDFDRADVALDELFKRKFSGSKGLEE